MNTLRRLLYPFAAFAPDDGAGSGTPPPPPEPPAEDPPASGKFTAEQQAEVDRIVGRARIAERKKHESEMAEASRLAQMSEAEKLKAEKDAADKRATEATSAAGQRVIKAEAKVAALSLGIKSERVAYVLKLADLSAIEIGDDGEPDAKSITAAIQQVLTDLPELKGTGGAGNIDVGPQGSGSANQPDLEKMTMAEYAKHWAEQGSKK